MSKLNQNTLRFVPISGLFILFLTISPEVSAQYFDSLMFSTHGIYWPESVIFMGDQNDDGFDDFMVSKMDSNSGGSLAKSYFYYGGSPIPDTPAFFINIFKPLSITACDVNRDGYRDIINHRGVIDTYPVSYDVYFGGPDLDTIPDFVIYHPDSNHISILYGRDWPIDFDGDGWESVRDMNGDGKGELIIYLNEGGSGAHGLSYGSRPPDFVPELRLNANGLEGVSLSPGDVNCDGYEDLIRRVPYDYYALYLGGQTITGLIAQFYRSSNFNRTLNFSGRVGDVNGDGIDDICLGENAGYTPRLIPPGDLCIYAGTRTPSSIEEEVVEKTEEKNIEIAISPNPTNGKVNIHYSIPDSGMLTSEIFDILGQKIYNNSTQEEKGSHTKELNIQTFTATSGIYIFHFTLETGEKTLTKSVKVQLIK